MMGIDTKLVDDLISSGYTKEIKLDVLIEDCENTFISLNRNGAAFKCNGIDEATNELKFGYGITPFEAVARMRIAVRKPSV